MSEDDLFHGPAWKFGAGKTERHRKDPAANAACVDRRECIGWPEIGDCSKAAMAGEDYCRACEEERRLAEGEPELGEE